MQVIEKKQVAKVRRKASQSLVVYDLNTRLPMGQVLDMSERGMKIMTEEPMEIGKKYYCKLPLERKIDGKKELFFDAECRWCRQNHNTGWYDSGYVLRFSSPQYAELLQKLIRGWMIDQISRLNPKVKKIVPGKRRLFKKIATIQIF